MNTQSYSSSCWRRRFFVLKQSFRSKQSFFSPNRDYLTTSDKLASMWQVSETQHPLHHVTDPNYSVIRTFVLMKFFRCLNPTDLAIVCLPRRRAPQGDSEVQTLYKMIKQSHESACFLLTISKVLGLIQTAPKSYYFTDIFICKLARPNWAPN